MVTMFSKITFSPDAFSRSPVSSGTDLLPCDWVACLQPPQAPAFTNLRHTGWWVKLSSYMDVAPWCYNWWGEAHWVVGN